MRVLKNILILLLVVLIAIFSFAIGASLWFMEKIFGFFAGKPAYITGTRPVGGVPVVSWFAGAMASLCRKTRQRLGRLIRRHPQIWRIVRWIF